MAHERRPREYQAAADVERDVCPKMEREWRLKFAVGFVLVLVGQGLAGVSLHLFDEYHYHDWGSTRPVDLPWFVDVVELAAIACVIAGPSLILFDTARHTIETRSRPLGEVTVRVLDTPLLGLMLDWPAIGHQTTR